MSGALRVTEATYPALHEALETISHDMGRRSGHEGYDLWSLSAEDLGRVEAALQTLDGVGRPGEDTELTTLCIGEESEMQAIALRSPELTLAWTVLRRWFLADWS